MSTRSRSGVLRWLIFLVGVGLTGGQVWAQTRGTPAAGEKGATGAGQTWTKVSVDLPTSDALFPAGNGADIANGQCLICHSAGMVLRQPPLTEDQWRGEINKMRNSFGAPLPADQVDALARYLYGVDGSHASGGR